MAAPVVYTVKQVAEILQQSPDQVYRLIHQKQLPAINLSPMGDKGRSWRVPEAALNKYLERIVSEVSA